MSEPNVVSLSDIPTNVAVAEVVQFGDKLTVPATMSLAEARDLLLRREEYLEEEMGFSEVFPYLPLDGANALNVVLERIFGFSCAEPTPGMFGDSPPQLVNIEVAPKVFRKVPWGRFSLPGAEDGWLACSAKYDGKKVCFAIYANVKRKYEDKITKLFDEVRAELNSNSIYKGQALKVRFLDDDGDPDPMAIPQFMDLTDVDEEMLIYSDTVATKIRNELFLPIERTNDLILNDVPIKRGVLLAGTYGVGKTLGAKVAAKKAVQTGNTFLYTPHADELDYAIEFAKQYQSPACVIFVEDIDRAIKGERSVSMDDILNIVDGIDTKTARIITVLTSNHLESINPAMLRPGRLDSIIEVTPPDAKAVERLLRSYGGDTIGPDVNLSAAASALQGQIPAVIAEVVKRAKLVELSRTEPGERIKSISEAALIEAAESITFHTELLARRAAEGIRKLPVLEETIVEIVRHAITNRDTGVLANAIR